jgi:acyl carrier protein
MSKLSAERIKLETAKFLKVSQDRMGDDVVLSTLVAQSFLLIEMIMHLQEELDVMLIQEDLKNVRTVGDLVAVFLRKQP